MADPAERDLGFVEPALPLITAAARRWFRPDVAGWEHVPDSGPVLFVGNHSGGAGSPDSVVFVLTFLERFGTGRPLYWLGHSLLMAVPGLSAFLRRCGVLPASPAAAAAVLARGDCLVVYPGGEVELHRPWTARNEIRFLGRTGFLRLALETGAPLVPVVASGGHHTYLPLTDGRRLARALGLRDRLDLRVLPVALALPWGVNIGPWLPNLPLPARIRIRILEPIDVRSRFGDDLDAGYEHVTSVMQATLDGLA